MFRRPRRFLPLYIVWIAFCAFLFAALKNLEDPARPEGRILSYEAGRRALSILRERDAARFGGYEVVHVGRARGGEGAPEDRWVVLCDRVPHSALAEAVVVEIERDSGKLLRIRKPPR